MSTFSQYVGERIALTSYYSAVVLPGSSYWGDSVAGGISEYFDLSAIPANSKINSAVIKHSALKRDAKGVWTLNYGSKSVNLQPNNTTALSISNTTDDVSSWFTGMTSFSSNFKVIYYFKATVPSTTPSGGPVYVNGVFENSTLEIDYSPPSSTGTLSSSSVTAGNSLTMTITPNAPTNKHKIIWKIGSSTVQTTSFIPAGTTTYTRTFPVTECSYCTTGTSVASSAILVTYDSGGTETGRNTYSYTFKVPSSVAPVIDVGDGDFVITDTVSRIVSLMGQGNYIKGKSKIKFTATPTGMYGATIAKVVFEGNGETLTDTTASSGSYSATCASYLQNSGSQTFKATATDSRGRTTTATITATVYDYSTPSLSSVTVKRSNTSGVASDDGQNIVVKAKFNYSKLTVNGTDKNSVTVTSTITPKGGSETQGRNIAASNTATVINTENDSVDIDKTYTVKLKITDTLSGTSSYVYTIPTMAYIMHWNKDSKSMGIGRAASDVAKRLSIASDWTTEMGTLKSADINITPLSTSSSPVLRFYDGSYADGTATGLIYVNRSTASSNVGRMYFRTTYPGETYGENYRLPTPATGLSANENYAILTNKNTVTVAQGGTGQTTTAAVKTAFGIPTFTLSGTTLAITL